MSAHNIHQLHPPASLWDRLGTIRNALLIVSFFVGLGMAIGSLGLWGSVKAEAARNDVQDEDLDLQSLSIMETAGELKALRREQDKQGRQLDWLVQSQLLLTRDAGVRTPPLPVAMATPEGP